MNFPQIIKCYPNFQSWEAGGGCLALRHELNDGGYLLITEKDNVDIPPDDATEVTVGRYTSEDERPLGDSTPTIPVDSLMEWIDRQLRVELFSEDEEFLYGVIYHNDNGERITFVVTSGMDGACALANELTTCAAVITSAEDA